MTAGVPVIDAGRLILRGRTLADFPAYAAMWADPDVARFTGGKTLSEEEAWIKFTRMAGLWALTGYGFWIAEEKETRMLVGEVGLAEFRRDIEPSLEGKPEFGWVLATAAQGKGFATEATRAALVWADEKFPGAAFSCIIDANNAPSIRVAEKCGFALAAVGRYRQNPINIYERAPSSAG